MPDTPPLPDAAPTTPPLLPDAAPVARRLLPTARRLLPGTAPATRRLLPGATPTARRLLPGATPATRRLLPGTAPVAQRLLTGAALVALALLWATAGMRSAWLYEGGLAVAGVSAAVVIASVVAAPESLPARLLSRRPVVRIGRLSYSLYLWHWPVHVYATHEWTGLARPLTVTAELAVTLALGAASFALVETPTRRIRRPAALAVPLLACGSLVLAGAVYARPAPPAEQRTGVVVHGHP